MATEYTTQRNEYKGNALIEIWANGRRVLSFGQRKAEAILETFSDIEDFVTDTQQAKERAKAREETIARFERKEVTVP